MNDIQTREIALLTNSSNVSVGCSYLNISGCQETGWKIGNLLQGGGADRHLLLVTKPLASETVTKHTNCTLHTDVIGR